MVYRLDVTVDSADELSAPVYKDIAISSNEELGFANTLSKSRRTLSGSSANATEELDLPKLPASRKKRRTSQGAVAGKKRTGIHWVLGCSRRPENNPSEDFYDSQESYLADLDEPESDSDGCPVVAEGSKSGIDLPNGSEIEASTSGLMVRNPIFDFHADAFGMAIGDGGYNSDDWGEYSYHVMSRMLREDFRTGFAARHLE